jgi:hypothetical protein
MGEEKRIYRPLEILTDQEIERILKDNNLDEMILLPLSVGEYHPNWKFAQDLCVKMSSHEDERVRANAVLGFAYIARTKGILEKRIVKPIVLNELNENKEYQWRIIDAINDINLFMKWKIGKKALDRINE